ncbi:hypothetical protein C8R47DRAFT_1205501 [Mycena vitilis]|nr:hypothetical protein C8R47DRAFT_1205501 [Mycena vitilis]
MSEDSWGFFEPPSRFAWAILSPSARESVAYLESTLATSAAADVKCGDYLALVKIRPETDVLSDDSVLAYLVQPSHYPLPDTYLSILPCQLGTREQLEPGFEWPFVQSIDRYQSQVYLQPCGGWKRNTLAANLPTSDASFVWRICERLPHVVSAILEEEGAPRGRTPTYSLDP